MNQQIINEDKNNKSIKGYCLWRKDDPSHKWLIIADRWAIDFFKKVLPEFERVFDITEHDVGNTHEYKAISDAYAKMLEEQGLTIKSTQNTIL